MRGILVQTRELDGATSMALDEVLWNAAAAGTAFLRLYRWADRPVLSLGYFQCYEEVARDPVLARLPCVRRLSGGGAIVHDDELTYSLAMPSSVAPATRDLYRLVHREVASRLEEFGFPATAGVGHPSRENFGTNTAPRSSRDRQTLCFIRGDDLAVRVSGVKVLGSAQRRSPDSVLMHGSLLLGSSPAAPHVPGLSELVGRRVEPGSMETVLREAIEAALGVIFEARQVSEFVHQALELAQAKYRSVDWNHRS